MKTMVSPFMFCLDHALITDMDGSQGTSTVLTQEQLDREQKIKINYRTLPDELKNVRSFVKFDFIVF